MGNENSVPLQVSAGTVTGGAVGVTKSASVFKCDSSAGKLKVASRADTEEAEQREAGRQLPNSSQGILEFDPSTGKLRVASRADTEEAQQREVRRQLPNSHDFLYFDPCTGKLRVGSRTDTGDAQQREVGRRMEKEYEEYENEETEKQREEEAKAKEKTRRRKEEIKRLRLEKEMSLRRAQLFKYQFGNKTGLDSFRGLPIEDVTQLRIGVFGPTGSGKSCFINTCERTVRETEKGSAPDSTTGQEGTITLQEYLPELFFRLVDTRGFFNNNANETVEFQNILYGNFQPGDNVTCPPASQDSSPGMDLHPCSAFADRLHGVIFVFMADDPRLNEGALKDYLNPFRDILRKTGIAPITVVTHRDRLKTEEECSEALHKASAATGSAPHHTFLVINYTRDDRNRSPETESLIFDILHNVLLTAERAVKIMKHQQKNKEEDEMIRVRKRTTITEQVAPDSAEASVEIFLRHLQKEYQWSTNGLKNVLRKLSDDEVTSVRLLAMCWRDVQAHFPSGMERMVGKELRTRNMIP